MNGFVFTEKTIKNQNTPLCFMNYYLYLYLFHERYRGTIIRGDVLINRKLKSIFTRMDYPNIYIYIVSNNSEIKYKYR